MSGFHILGRIDNSLIAALSAEGARRYGDMMRRFKKQAHARESSGSESEVVAGAIRRTLTARRPRAGTSLGKTRDR